MTRIEAQDLAFDIRTETGMRTNLLQIGNGEWVVLVNRMFVWSAQDWENAKGQV